MEKIHLKTGEVLEVDNTATAQGPWQVGERNGKTIYNVPNDNVSYIEHLPDITSPQN